MIEDLGLASEVIGASSSSTSRYIWYNGALQALKVTSPLILKSLPQLIMEPFRKQRNYETEGDESIYDFVNRRFGPFFANVLFDAMVTGIYCGDVKQLSMRSCFHKLVEMEARSGSVVKGMIDSMRSTSDVGDLSDGMKKVMSSSSISFKGGMETLIDALAGRLYNDEQTNIYINHHVSAIRKMEGSNKLVVDVVDKSSTTSDSFPAEYDHVFSTLPAYALARIIKNVPNLADASATLKSLPHVNVAVINLGYNTAVVPLEAFGFLAPSCERAGFAGVVLDSKTFPQQSAMTPDESRLTVMMGGAHDPLVSSLPEGDIVEKATEAVRATLGISHAPDSVVVSVAKKCIPQYPVGHHSAMEEMKGAVARELPSLTVGGTAVNGVSLINCIVSGKTTAENFVTKLL
jgi:oxygen-dependent protoporphyrinogen oxidase